MGKNLLKNMDLIYTLLLYNSPLPSRLEGLGLIRSPSREF